MFLTVDTSGSMDATQINSIADLSPRMAAAAVCLTVARREPNHMITACSAQMETLDVMARDSLQDVMNKTKAHTQETNATRY